MTFPTIRSIAIIGSGISGLTVGNLVRDAGVDAVVFEKARGPGGRISSKRWGSSGVDMGAQYLTIRTDAFREFLGQRAPGAVAPWSGRLRHENGQGELEPFPEETRCVGFPRMSAISRVLSEPLNVETATPVRQAWQGDGKWRLETDRGRFGPYDALVVTTPPAQASTLLPGLQDSGLALEDFRMSPCWAVAAQFPERLHLGFEGASLRGPVLDWVACDSSKPGRDSGGNCWVLHATPSWSRQNLGLAPDEAAERLLSAFRERFGIKAEPLEWIGHCWRYARPDPGGDAPGWLSLDALGLGICGDWLCGGRVEGAFTSGLALIAHWRSLGLIPEVAPGADRNG